MLSLIANIISNALMAKPKLTREAITVVVASVTAFLFFSCGTVFGLTSLDLYLKSSGISEMDSSIYITAICFAVMAVLLIATKIYTNRAKKNKVDGIDRAIELAEAFMAGFNSDTDSSLRETEKLSEQREKLKTSLHKVK